MQLQHPPFSRKWLTMNEYADAMGMSYSTVKRMKLAKQIPCRQEGNIVRIPIEATDYEWLENWRESSKRHMPVR